MELPGVNACTLGNESPEVVNMEPYISTLKEELGPLD